MSCVSCELSYCEWIGLVMCLIVLCLSTRLNVCRIKLRGVRIQHALPYYYLSQVVVLVVAADVAKYAMFGIQKFALSCTISSLVQIQ